MTDAYTYISKPIGTPYTYINPQGKETYDQPNLTYDNLGIFYDGVNQTAWTDILKPALPFKFVGMTVGLLIPLTKRFQSTGTDWTAVNKPTT